MSPPERRRKHWGWGFEDQQPDRAGLEAMAPMLRDRLGFGGERVTEPVPLEEVELPKPRVEASEALAEIADASPHARASHAMGQAYRDVVRGLHGRFDHVPDLVLRPRSEAEVEALLEWCSEAGVAAIPFGGGTSVVGGVEPRLEPGEWAGAASIDLGALDRVLEIDETSQAARIQAGATGPKLEDQLRERGMTMRFYPQSFELSTLGGWVATRAGGHFATIETHIDDLVESIRAITPAGAWQSRRLPGSGAGPSPDRMLLGSEGALGVVTEAWVRIRPRPVERATRSVAFESFEAGAAAVRSISQSGLGPSNCRLLDPLESATNQAGPPGKAMLVLGFESAGTPVAERLELALEIAREHGGEAEEPAPRESAEKDGDSAGSWRAAFMAAPYLRDALVQLGVLTETFETAITWDRFPDFHASVTDAVRGAVARECGLPLEGEGSPRVSCRFTHVYPDGPAPYYTVLAPAREGSEVEQWDAIKASAGEEISRAGATITHHHAVGRDHRPWYDEQRPELFAGALRAARRSLDPAGVMNPGVLVDP